MLAILAAVVSLTALRSPAPSCENNPLSLYDGYVWVDGSCVPGYLAVESWFRPAPDYAYGAAVFYAPTAMEATAAWRGLSLKGYLDGVAMMSPADIGRTVWMRRPGEPWEGPFLVVDSAARQDMWPVVMIRGEIIEIGFRTAERWGMASPTGLYEYRAHRWRIDGVEVLKADHPPAWLRADFRDSPSLFRMMPDPVDYRYWFESHALLLNRRSEDYGMRPIFIPPNRWLWIDRETILGPYDDWYGFLDGILGEQVIASPEPWRLTCNSSHGHTPVCSRLE